MGISLIFWYVVNINVRHVILGVKIRNMQFKAMFHFVWRVQNFQIRKCSKHAVHFTNSHILTMQWYYYIWYLLLYYETICSLAYCKCVKHVVKVLMSRRHWRNESVGQIFNLWLCLTAMPSYMHIWVFISHICPSSKS